MGVAEDLSASFFESYNVFANAKAQSQTFTIECNIESVIDSYLGQYKATYLGQSITVVNNNANIVYNEGDRVLVLISNGDFSKTKYIIGSSAGTTSSNIAPYEGKEVTYFEIESFLNEGNSIQLCSYYPENIRWTLSEYFINNFSSIFSETLNKYNNFYISCDVDTSKMNKEQWNRGNFGIRLHLPLIIREEASANSTSMDLTETIVTLDSTTMNGNPYALSNVNQVMYFTIDNLKYQLDTSRLNEIWLEGFVEDGGFNKHSHDGMDSHWDIGFSNITFKCIDYIEDTSGYHLNISSTEGSFFNSKSKKTKTLTPELVVNGKSTTLTTKNTEFYWFQRDCSINVNSSDYHVRGGNGWRCLNNKVKTTTDTDRQVDTSLSTYEVSSTDVWTTNTYKCVIVYDGQIASATINITNQDSGIDFNIQQLTNITDNVTSYAQFQSNVTLPSDKLVNSSDTFSKEYSALIQNSDLSADERYSKIQTLLANNIVGSKGVITYTWAIADSIGNFKDITRTNNNGEIETYNPFSVTAIEDNDPQNLTETVEIDVNNLTDIYTILCTANYNSVQQIKYTSADNETITVQQNVTVPLGTKTCSISSSTEGSFAVAVANGDKLYKYDADGDAPTLSQLYDGPSSSLIEGIDPIEITLYNKDGTELDIADYQNCIAKWYLPKDSMLDFSSLFEGDNAIPKYVKGNNYGLNDVYYTEDTNYYYLIGNAYINKTLNYAILDKYDISKDDNTIIVDVIFNGLTTVTKTLPIQFLKDGQAGTNGLKYSAYIGYSCNGSDVVPYDGILNGTRNVKLKLVYLDDGQSHTGDKAGDNYMYNWYIYNTYTDTMERFVDATNDNKKLIAKVYKDGSLISSNTSEVSIKWSVLKESNDNEVIGNSKALLPPITASGNQSYCYLGTSSVKANTSWLGGDGVHVCIVRAAIKCGEVSSTGQAATESSKYIYAYYPIETIYVNSLITASLTKNGLINKAKHLIPKLIGGPTLVEYSNDGKQPSYDNSKCRGIDDLHDTYDELYCYTYNWSGSDDFTLTPYTTGGEVAEDSWICKVEPPEVWNNVDLSHYIRMDITVNTDIFDSENDNVRCALEELKAEVDTTSDINKLNGLRTITEDGDIVKVAEQQLDTYLNGYKYSTFKSYFEDENLINIYNTRDKLIDILETLKSDYSTYVDYIINTLWPIMNQFKEIYTEVVNADADEEFKTTLAKGLEGFFSLKGTTNYLSDVVAFVNNVGKDMTILPGVINNANKDIDDDSWIIDDCFIYNNSNNKITNNNSKPTIVYYVSKDTEEMFQDIYDCFKNLTNNLVNYNEAMDTIIAGVGITLENKAKAYECIGSLIHSINNQRLDLVKTEHKITYDEHKRPIETSVVNYYWESQVYTDEQKWAEAIVSDCQNRIKEILYSFNITEVNTVNDFVDNFKQSLIYYEGTGETQEEKIGLYHLDHISGYYYDVAAKIRSDKTNTENNYKNFKETINNAFETAAGIFNDVFGHPYGTKGYLRIYQIIYQYIQNVSEDIEYVLTYQEYGLIEEDEVKITSEYYGQSHPIFDFTNKIYDEVYTPLLKNDILTSKSDDWTEKGLIYKSDIIKTVYETLLGYEKDLTFNNFDGNYIPVGLDSIKNVILVNIPTILNRIGCYNDFTTQDYYIATNSMREYFDAKIQALSLSISNNTNVADIIDIFSAAATADTDGDSEVSEIIYIKPLFFYRSLEGMSNLLAWDGTKLEIDDNGQYIYSPQVGTGYKDDSNVFHGLLMGSVSETTNDGTSTTSGLIGYTNINGTSQRTILLDADTGVAEFGCSNGRIILDPREDAKIYSGNYFYSPETGTGKGMEINLTDATLRWGNGYFSVDENGRLTASHATITGNLNATSGVFSGVLAARTGFFLGSLLAREGYIGGEINILNGEDKYHDESSINNLLIKSSAKQGWKINDNMIFNYTDNGNNSIDDGIFIFNQAPASTDSTFEITVPALFNQSISGVGASYNIEDIVTYNEVVKYYPKSVCGANESGIIRYAEDSEFAIVWYESLDNNGFWICDYDKGARIYATTLNDDGSYSISQDSDGKSIEYNNKSTTGTYVLIIEGESNEILYFSLDDLSYTITGYNDTETKMIQRRISSMSNILTNNYILDKNGEISDSTYSGPSINTYKHFFFDSVGDGFHLSEQGLSIGEGISFNEGSHEYSLEDYNENYSVGSRTLEGFKSWANNITNEDTFNKIELYKRKNNFYYNFHVDNSGNLISANGIFLKSNLCYTDIYDTVILKAKIQGSILDTTYIKNAYIQSSFVESSIVNGISYSTALVSFHGYYLPYRSFSDTQAGYISYQERSKYILSSEYTDSSVKNIISKEENTEEFIRADSWKINCPCPEFAKVIDFRSYDSTSDADYGLMIGFPRTYYPNGEDTYSTIIRSPNNIWLKASTLEAPNTKIGHVKIRNLVCYGGTELTAPNVGATQRPALTINSGGAKICSGSSLNLFDKMTITGCTWTDDTKDKDGNITAHGYWTFTTANHKFKITSIS